MQHLRPRAPLALLCLSLLIACAAAPLPPEHQARLAALLPADALLLGEQHDAPEHQQLQRQTVEWLTARGELAALAMEMAEQGRDTRALPPSASEAEVRQALAWHDAGWPWPHYGPVVMAAVRAGVPVLGANLPRARLREAMADTTLDARLPPAALTEQERRIREGHCHALPEARIRPMVRVQIARDLAMADTLAKARQPGRTVLLVAGNGHVQRALGVPLHLSEEFKTKVLSAQAQKAQAATDMEASRAGVDLVWPTPPLPPRDHCAAFRPPAPAAR
ncbi:MAG: ChaN family lipoprotein [Pseudomonadota bacterium]|nr:ChaN family lipoprotein [Pseudomonadota bacterium]